MFTIAVASLLAGCGPIENTSDVGNVTDQLSDGPSAALDVDRPSPMHTWKAYSNVDPLTDVETMIAGRTFRTGSYYVALEVGCDDRKDVTYTATTFDENNEGTPLDWTFGPNRMQFQVRTRLDRDDAQIWSADKRRFSNQFRLSYSMKELARGTSLTMRFAMPNADVTIFVDQGDPVFRNVVEPCLAFEPEPAPATPAEPEASTEPSFEADAVPEPVSNLSPRASENSDEDPS